MALWIIFELAKTISIVSAVIALIAVYFTYNQAKISNNQFELELKKIEKPIIIEKIQTKINPLQNELKTEIKAINDKELAWIVTNDLYYLPLIFPIPDNKNFHKSFPDNFHIPDIQRDSRLQELIKEIGMNVQKRYDIYAKTEDTLHRFTDEIDQSHFDKRVVDLLINTGYEIEIQEQKSTKPLGRFETPEDYVENKKITKEKTGIIIKSLIISTLFKSLKKDDPRLIWIGEGEIPTKLFSKISQHLLNDPIPQCTEIKQSIEDDLASLSDLDNKILKDIENLKEIYQAIYAIKECDLNPSQGIR
ncbi:MAG: hypothetical protein Q8N94_07785 [Methanoregula sp.]|nr:hypothetical protein [Methanoregula sp.]